MKTPIVLVSGLLSNATLWQHQIRCLRSEGEVIAVAPASDTPEKMVAEILEAAPPRFALAGHSMGGWLCLEVMRTAPSRVTRLCLLNTTARSDSEEKRRKRLEMIRQVEEGHFADVVAALLDHFVYNAAVRPQVESMFLAVGRHTFINQERAMLGRRESETILSMIRCPTLVVHASQDKNFSEDDHRELVDAIPGAAYAAVEGAGHMSPMEAPEAVASLLQRFFL